MLKEMDLLNAKEQIEREMETENSFFFQGERELTVDEFSSNGLSQLGTRTKFPTQFVNQLVMEQEDNLANEIINTQTKDYFGRREGKPMLFRQFFGRTHAVLSEKYNVFDDDEVVKMVEGCDYLTNAEEVWGDISPDHLHLRFISGNKLHIEEDDSPLSMCVFVDNSMCGLSALKVRFGIYRWACTNGMIGGLKEFTLLKERHFGEKDFSIMLNEVFEEVPLYEEMLLNKVKEMANAKSHIYNMTDEDAVSYIKDKLNLGKKQSAEIIELYKSTYGGHSKWDLVNAITDYSHKYETLERTRLETLAMKVA